ncbi:cytochrome c3 family protein [Geobacter sp. DSM 9736]|uniref:cytochrome c3 family protein n=1 Tax=Geobacter sp. DSM 9736 TaxID=1277350 RepID=UPI000B509C9A|nr:cytochrome c3 family protein [Geobacter sp. DSM 9736]SNB45273.1 Doubled CXXCH motif (Paired_CXXCH_1) [Geobacter sp. DSM 9736]
MKWIIRCSAAVFALTVSVSNGGAAGPKISDMTGGNKHNLSSLNTNVTYKADPSDPRGREICIFCHTPHNSRPQTTLWNRKDPTATFGHYSSSTLVISRAGVPSSYGEPTGSSRLCLSCHDGVTAGGVSLGDILTGGPINMGANDRITGRALFDAEKIRSGHHPVSFVYNAAVLNAIQSDPVKAAESYSLPTLPQVKLDREERMQCTTCHNPHQNQSTEEVYTIPPNNGRKIAPFWVYGATGNAITDHDAVCLTCHNLTSSPFR